MAKKRVNWHLGVRLGIEIDLRDYAEYLEYEDEVPLRNNDFRMDLLILRKKTDILIKKALACDFRDINIFETKGVGSSLTITSYYKLIGYVGLYLSILSKHDHKTYDRRNVTLCLLGRHYPRKLIAHLCHDCQKTIAKIAPGIYDVSEETFLTRIVVTGELSDDDYLYLRCLGNDLEAQPEQRIRRLNADINGHVTEPLYNSYVSLLTRANTDMKGDRSMICEGVLEFFGTSEEEIRRKQKEEDQIFIDKANERADEACTRADKANQLASEEKSRADRYRSILIAHGLNPDEPISG